MQNQTFHLLKRAFINDVDKEALQKSKLKESPFIQQEIDLVLKQSLPNIQFDTLHFSSRNVDSRKLLEETVITYILFISNIVKHEKFSRTFLRPGAWDGDRCWIQLLKFVMYCIFTLIYNIRWTSINFFDLDKTIDHLLQGRAEALRDFMKSLNIPLKNNSLYPAEKSYESLMFHPVNVFGPYHWRLLHWMAEAFEMRNGNHADIDQAKSIWREFVSKSLHRTLRCNICMYHYQNIAQTFKEKFLNDNNYSKIWFDIHNLVRSVQLKSNYSESEFETDRAFMKSALVP
ncbi:sulfhydryl oxidase [Trichonephila inaurata madagascariensis]|uniref:Sulfhydryl oxidase n=1 Tax=Trichonephila inaurata madagascariensis TaxID=2747483 RepID=A0A8X6Y739_9ARAC|nr:sulfhydryl oxidase [Trichonephila inaurata madagascariensis]